MSNDNHQGDQERREYFRIDDYVLLSYTVITKENEAEFFAELDSPPPSAFTLASHLTQMKQENMVLRRRAQSENSSLTKYVHAIETQLDMIVQVLMVNEMDDPEFSKKRKVSIGGGGLSLFAAKEVEEGSLLDVKMVLFPGHLGLRTAGKVVRCKPDGDQFDIGIEFNLLSDADNELLVQHVLSKQASQLRKQREEKWDSEQ